MTLCRGAIIGSLLISGSWKVARKPKKPLGTKVFIFSSFLKKKKIKTRQLEALKKEQFFLQTTYNAISIVMIKLSKIRYFYLKLAVI